MSRVYEVIAEQRVVFMGIAERFTNDINEVDEAVQELMLYFMGMNKETLETIYHKDGVNGIIRYGAVALRRAFTSPRSSYFYKYRKYYTNLDDTCNTTAHTNRTLQGFAEEIEETHKWEQLESIDKYLEEMYWYDREVFKLYYYEENTLSSLAKKTGISRNCLFTTIDKVRKELKENINE